MKSMLSVFLMTSLLAFSAQSMAATVEVKWVNPDDYQDIDEGQRHKKKFRTNLFSQLEKHLAKLAEKLPEDQTLQFEVTDVDLAGDTRFDSMNEIRVIKEIYYPRIEFSYRLLDGQKNEISTGSENLKDMSFMMKSSLKYRSRPLNHEKVMLESWFKSEFLKS